MVTVPPRVGVDLQEDCPSFWEVGRVFKWTVRSTVDVFSVGWRYYES